MGAISDTYQRRPGLAILLILVSNEVVLLDRLGGRYWIMKRLFGEVAPVPGTSFLSDSIPAATGIISRTRLKTLRGLRARSG